QAGSGICRQAAGQVCSLNISLYSPLYIAIRADGPPGEKGYSMHRVIRGALALLCPVFAAVAQVTEAPTPEDGKKDVTTLDNVTVTARQREEDLQKVPMAVSVVNGECLDPSDTR